MWEHHKLTPAACTMRLFQPTRPLPCLHALCYLVVHLHSAEACKAPTPYSIIRRVVKACVERRRATAESVLIKEGVYEHSAQAWANGERTPPPPVGGGLGGHGRHRMAGVDRGCSGAGGEPGRNGGNLGRADSQGDVHTRSGAGTGAEAGTASLHAGGLAAHAG